MKYLLTLLVFLILNTNNSAIAEQTWDQPTGARKDYYFLVPQKLTVISTGEPTDFYASYLSEELEWVKISPKYGWGVIANPFTFDWIPDYPIRNTSLGIHTSPRNENNYGFEPTDITDSLVNVIFANAEFYNVPTSYTFYEDYTLYFNYTPNTLPYSIQLEASYDEITWFEFKNVLINNSGQQKIEVFNDLVKDKPIKLRLTYNHRVGKQHNIATTSWISYNTPKFKVIDKLQLEYGIFNDITEFVLEYQKEYLSNNRSFILSYLVANQDTTFLDTIVPNQYIQTIKPIDIIKLNDFNGSVKVLYYSAWGELLNELTLKLQDKYLTLNQYSTDLIVGENVTFNWSNSNHFSKIKIYEAKLDFGSDEYNVIASDWDINKDYKVYKREPGVYKYLFEAQDGTQELFTESSPITWINKQQCKEDSLKVVIDSLYSLIASIKQDTLIYTLLVDAASSVIGENEEPLTEIEFLLAMDEFIKIDFNYNIKNIYLADLKGNFLPVMFANNSVELDISQFASGVYLMFIVKSDLKVKTYKFIK
jgi:hypothetical protein